MLVRCLQAFRVAEDCADGAVEVEVNGEDGVGAAAARACAAINDKARSEGMYTRERERVDGGDFFLFKKKRRHMT